MYTRFKYPLLALLRQFKAVEFAKSTGQDRPAMTGILWEVKRRPRRNRMVATDGHRMVIAEGEKIDGNFSVIIPPKLIQTCLPNLPKAKHSLEKMEKETVEIVINDAKIGIIYNNKEIVSRLIEGPYPDYEKVIPHNYSRESEPYPHKLRVDRKTFIEKIRALLPFTNKLTSQIKFSLAPPKSKCASFYKIILSVSSPEGETMTTELPGEYEGEEFEVAYNGKYLLSTLRHFAEDTIILAPTGALSAAALWSLDEKGKGNRDKFFQLLMPILLD